MNVDNKINSFVSAYNSFVVRSKPYIDSINKVSSLVNGSKTVLDAGCGTGDMLLNLHTTNPELTSIGVDFLPEMVTIAKEKLKNYSSSKIVVGDFNVLPLGTNFDAVTSFNVLLNLSSPMLHLQKAYHSLKPGGLFILSSPKVIPNLAAMKQNFLKEINNHPEKELLISRAAPLFEKQVGIANDFKNIYSLNQIKHILTSYMGFDSPVFEGETYMDSNFLIAVPKKRNSESLRFEISDKVKDFRDGFKLRYHVLHDWHRAIPSSSCASYFVESDLTGFAGVIRGSKSNNLVAFLNAVPSKEGVDGIADKQEYSKLSATFPNHLYLNSLAVVPYLQRKGIAVYLIAKVYQHAINQGYSAVIGEGNPSSSKLMERLGAKIIGEEVLDKSKNVHSRLSYADLSSPIVKNKVAEYSSRLEYLLD